MANNGSCHACGAEESNYNKMVEQPCGNHELCERCYNEGINCCSVGLM
jgi:hypothetical protein